MSTNYDQPDDRYAPEGVIRDIECRMESEAESWQERDARCRHTPGHLLAYAMDDNEADAQSACPTCDGEGWVRHNGGPYSDATKDCPTCHGEGSV